MGWEVSQSKSQNGSLPMFGTASIQLQSFRSKNSGARSRDHEQGPDEHLRPDNNNKYKASVYGPRQGDQQQSHKLKREASTGSADSQNPIIRKDVHFTISSESAPTSSWGTTG